LETQTLVYGSTRLGFGIESHVKERLMSGMDDIGITTSLYELAIRRYEESAPSYTSLAKPPE